MQKLANAIHLAAAVAAATAVTAATAAAASADPAATTGFKLRTFANAPNATTTGPDDIAYLDGHVFVGWQNGVGTKGEPNPTTGQTSSTVVEYSRDGETVGTWSLTGKVDGLGGDPAAHVVIATVNEDGNSGLYTIAPGEAPGSQVRHFQYSPAPDSPAAGGLFTGGGTDAVVVIDGTIFVSASNPTPPNATAAFTVRLDWGSGVANLSPTFADNATATDALSGNPVTLSLTDPDSNAVVPRTSPRFGGDFVLDSQGDQQLIFAGRGGDLTRLLLSHGGTSAGVDDIRWAAGPRGSLYIVDSGAKRIYQVTGDFAAGQAFASLDTVGSSADTTEVDTLNLNSGELMPFVTGFKTAKGLLWVP